MAVQATNLANDAAPHMAVPAAEDGRADFAMNADPLFDANGAAEYLGLVGVVKHPAQAVRTLCRKRHIRSTKVAGKVMVRRSWLEEYIEANARNAVE